MFRSITIDIMVAPQISVDAVAEAKAAGVALIINNRPEGESDDQIPGADIEAAARAAGARLSMSPMMATGESPAASTSSAPPSAATILGATALARVRSSATIGPPPIKVTASSRSTIMGPAVDYLHFRKHSLKVSQNDTDMISFPFRVANQLVINRLTVGMAESE